MWSCSLLQPPRANPRTSKATKNLRSTQNAGPASPTKPQKITLWTSTACSRVTSRARSTILTAARQSCSTINSTNLSSTTKCLRITGSAISRPQIYIRIISRTRTLTTSSIPIRRRSTILRRLTSQPTSTLRLSLTCPPGITDRPFQNDTILAISLHIINSYNMTLFRHKKLLHYRKIKHICFLRKINLRITTLNHIRSQPSYISNSELLAMSPEERKELRDRNP